MGTIVKDMPPLIPKSEGRLPVTTPTTPETAGGGIPTSTASPSSSPLLLADLIRPHGVVGGGGGGQEEDSSSPLRVAALSNPWEYNALQKNCSNCRVEFNAIIRRHHCRLCGKIFCNNCSDQRALIPPSSIVLTPDGGKHVSPRGGENNNNDMISFSPDPDPDRMLSYLDENQQLLYGKGLEERFQLAREPLRVCGACWELLQPVQEELRNSNSNAMRFNHIDPNDPKRFLNSPLAFTLGHEVRKAAYALNNLLPSPKRMGSVIEYTQTRDIFLTGEAREIQQCHEECRTVTPNLSNLDGVKIPARLLEDAKGIAVMTVAKGGFGLAGVEFGTGLVVARLGEHQWSAPCAIGTMGVSWGALLGAQVSDHVFLLMTDDAVEMMFSNNGNIQLGADIGVAVGPVGRALEADIAASPGKLAPIYTYSMSRGLYAGVSLDGKVIVTRHRVNERFYGREVSGMELLSGSIPTPPAARPLYDALQRCHVYATGDVPNRRNLVLGTMPENESVHYPRNDGDEWVGGGSGGSNMMGNTNTEWGRQVYPESSEMEYGELPEPIPLYPPAANDQHSYAGMSDITSDPGY